MKYLKNSNSILLLIIIFSNVYKSKAQSGSIIDPNQITYGLGLAWQTKYATGIGLATHFQFSIIESLAKDRKKRGFKIRDINGGQLSVGALTHPKIPTIAGYTTSAVKGPIWYTAGLDYFGLQMSYVMNENFSIMAKGQLLWNLNNSAYIDNFSSKVLTAGAQVGPYGIEVSKGFRYGNNFKNLFSIGISRTIKEKGAGVIFMGIKYVKHIAELPNIYINGTNEKHIQSNHFLTIFSGFAF